MKKKIIFVSSLIVIILTFIIGGQNTISAKSVIDISVYIDNEKVNFPDVKPYISNNCTLVPARYISEVLGATLNWDQISATVTISKNNNLIIMVIGSTKVQKNGIDNTMAAAPIIKNGRIMVPLRFIAESLGGSVQWEASTSTAKISTENNKMKPTAFNINGGLTGIFTRKQLNFDGYDGIEADITLPKVTLAEKGDCPYVYLGFDFKNDIGNVEGGFQFIEDEKHKHYNQWTAVIRQGKDWRWGNNIYLEQGSKHHLKFYLEEISKEQVDLIIKLDGIEIIRKKSSVNDFSKASVKTVISMAMSKKFDGTNCLSRSEHAKLENVRVSKLNSDEYLDFSDFELYSEWKPNVGESGMWFGTIDCIPSYLHNESDGSISIYKK